MPTADDFVDPVFVRKLQAMAADQDLANRFQVEPTRGWRLPQRAMPRKPEATGCYGCYRSEQAIGMMGHVPGCRLGK